MGALISVKDYKNAQWKTEKSILAFKRVSHPAQHMLAYSLATNQLRREKNEESK